MPNNQEENQMFQISEQISKIEYIAKFTKLGILGYKQNEKIKIEEMIYILENIQELSVQIKQDIYGRI